MSNASADVYTALEPFLNTNDPAQLRQIVESFPILLELETLAALEKIIAQYDGNEEMREFLQSRYAMLQAMREYGSAKVLDMFAEHFQLVERTDVLQTFLNTYGVEPLREFVAQHPELLNPAMDDLLDEVLAKYADRTEILQQIEAKRDILHEARRVGADVYFDELARQEPLMQQRLLLQEFLTTNSSAEERSLIDEYPQLLDPALDGLFDRLYEEYVDDEKALATLRFNQAQLQAYREHGLAKLSELSDEFEQQYMDYSEAWNAAREVGTVEAWQAAATLGEPLLSNHYAILPAVQQTTLRQHLAATFNELAVAQYNGENPDQAALSHRRVLELHPENAAAWRHHARLMIELGDREAAQLALSHAYNLDADSEELTELTDLFENLDA